MVYRLLTPRRRISFKTLSVKQEPSSSSMVKKQKKREQRLRDELVPGYHKTETGEYHMLYNYNLGPSSVNSLKTVRVAKAMIGGGFDRLTGRKRVGATVWLFYPQQTAMDEESRRWKKNCVITATLYVNGQPVNQVTTTAWKLGYPFLSLGYNVPKSGTYNVGISIKASGSCTGSYSASRYVRV